MNMQTVKKLSHGLYRIYWKHGGSSLAAVGSDASGNRWVAPTNWISGPSIHCWRSVERAVLLAFEEIT